MLCLEVVMTDKEFEKYAIMKAIRRAVNCSICGRTVFDITQFHSLPKYSAVNFSSYVSVYHMKEFDNTERDYIIQYCLRYFFKPITEDELENLVAEFNEEDSKPLAELPKKTVFQKIFYFFKSLVN